MMPSTGDTSRKSRPPAQDDLIIPRPDVVVRIKTDPAEPLAATPIPILLVIGALQPRLPGA